VNAAPLAVCVEADGVTVTTDGGSTVIVEVPGTEPDKLELTVSVTVVAPLTVAGIVYATA
jgi:hypothetical protein